jgi:hypothetical protein
MLTPDYAYWDGWNEMTKDLGEIKELAKTIRATHKKPVKKYNNCAKNIGKRNFE